MGLRPGENKLLTREVTGYQLDSTAAISALQTSATGLGRWLV